MLAPLFAIGWDEFFRILFVLIGVLAWVVSHFSGKPKPQQARKPAAGNAPAQPNADPLQAEIDEFLRQAQAQREGRQEPQPPPLPQVAEEEPRRQRPKRRSGSGPAKRESLRRQLTSQPEGVTPVVVEVVPAERPRESLAEHLAHRADRSVFDQRGRQLSQMQQASDGEFQQHMQRVFDHDEGQLKPATLGIFEIAGTAAAAAAMKSASVSAAGAQSSTAPIAIRKGPSDIALFLAGRKNIRDAIILSEILKRPEQRW